MKQNLKYFICKFQKNSNFKLIKFLLVHLFFSFSLKSQITPEKLGLKEFKINSKQYGEINYYISSKDFMKQKPLLLYLDGSGPYPLFQYTKNGIASTIVIDHRVLSEEYHVVFISKPGVPFIDSVKMNSITGFPEYLAPKEYENRLSLNWRVETANLVIKEAQKQIKVDKNKIAIMGISEGFQVAAKLATLDNRISHTILLVGNGLTQFYDYVIENRLAAKLGKISEVTAQQNIDSLYRVIADIYANPSATNKNWYGHTYLRWSSFGANEPFKNIMSSTSKFYILGCSNDLNTSVLSSDYIKLEAIRLKKDNISYKVLPYDHQFNETIKDANGKIISMKSHLKEVTDDAFRWLKAQ